MEGFERRGSVDLSMLEGYMKQCDMRLWEIGC